MKYTEQEITGWADGYDKLIDALNEYIRFRNAIDPNFQCRIIEVDSSDLDDFSISCGVAKIVWTTYGGWGSEEEHVREIHLNCLWSDDWKKDIELDIENQRLAEIRQRETEEKRKLEEKELLRQRAEAHDRATYERLKKRFGDAEPSVKIGRCSASCQCSLEKGHKGPCNANIVRGVCRRKEQ